MLRDETGGSFPGNRRQRDLAGGPPLRQLPKSRALVHDDSQTLFDVAGRRLPPRQSKRRMRTRRSPFEVRMRHISKSRHFAGALALATAGSAAPPARPAPPAPRARRDDRRRRHDRHGRHDRRGRHDAARPGRRGLGGTTGAAGTAGSVACTITADLVAQPEIATVGIVTWSTTLVGHPVGEDRLRPHHLVRDDGAGRSHAAELPHVAARDEGVAHVPLSDHRHERQRPVPER